jgi:hypothetical protein
LVRFLMEMIGCTRSSRYAVAPVLAPGGTRSCDEGDDGDDC